MDLKKRTSQEGKKKAMEKSLRGMQGDYATLYEYQSERSYHGEILLHLLRIVGCVDIYVTGHGFF